MADLKLPADWRVCNQFPDYAVNVQGQIIRRRDHHLIPLFATRIGYLYASIRVGLRDYRKVYVHRQIALAFVPGAAEGLEVNHINGDRADNRAENLEWVTHAQNMASDRMHGRPGRPTLSGAVLTEADVLAIHAASQRGDLQREIAARFGVRQATISHIITGRQWRRLHPDKSPLAQILPG